jgi:hypothetical protein
MTPDELLHSYFQAELPEVLRAQTTPVSIKPRPVASGSRLLLLCLALSLLIGFYLAAPPQGPKANTRTPTTNLLQNATADGSRGPNAGK